MINWNRGEVLVTETTRKFSDKELQETFKAERSRIFTSWREHRQLVCVLNEAHPNYKINAALITLLPHIIKLLRSVSKKTDLPEDELLELKELFSLMDEAIVDSYSKVLDLNSFRKPHSPFR